MNTYLQLGGRKFTEAWVACMVAMTQGDLTVVSLKHAIVASKTGVITGLAMMATYAMCQKENKWLNIWLTGLFVTLADIVSHPSHYGSHYTEALITGLGAACLAYLVEEYLNRRKSSGA